MPAQRMNASKSNNKYHAGRKYIVPSVDENFHNNGRHRSRFECVMSAFFLYCSSIVDSKYIIFRSQNIHAKCSGIDEEMRRDKWNGSRQQQVHRLINVINGVHNDGPVGRMEAW